MKRLSWPTMSLRVRLILTYLSVALGAMLVLVIVITFVVQNYFYSTERALLRERAEFIAQRTEDLYRDGGRNWDNVIPLQLNSPDLFVVIDTNNQGHSVPSPANIKISSVDLPVVKQALTQSLHGQE